MRHSLHTAFQSFQRLEPTRNLREKIVVRIEQLEQKAVQRELFLSYIGIAGSLLSLVLVGIGLGQEFIQSDFWSMSALLFSDADVVLQHSADFIYSLLETFPFFSFTLFLFPVFVLALSLRFYTSVRTKGYQYSTV